MPVRFNKLVEAGWHRISQTRKAYRPPLVCTLELPVVSQWATRSAFESDVYKMETGETIRHGRVARGGARIPCVIPVDNADEISLVERARHSLEKKQGTALSRKGRPCAISVCLRAIFLSLMKLSWAHRNFTVLFSILTRGFDSRSLLSSRGSRLAKTLCLRLFDFEEWSS